MSAGQLKHRLSFQSRQMFSDGYGNERADFAEQFTRWAQVKPSLGIETVNAARLQGQQPVDLIVRRDAETAGIASDWQAIDVNEGTVYALTAPPIDLAQDRKYLTMKAVVGAAS